MHILTNGLSIGSGGGFTVGRMIFQHLAEARPDWRVTLVLTADRPLHEEMRAVSVPENAQILWAPPTTAGVRGRQRYENSELVEWVTQEKVDVSFELNGMTPRRMPCPSFCHFQDPWPYRPEAWTRPSDRLLAWVKRRAHRRSLASAAAAGWTSQYLRDTIVDRLQVEPAISEVLYNGVPDAWCQRRDQDVTPLAERPLRLVTVSNVSHYKRQWLVIDAMADLVRRPGLGDLHYHIAGACADDCRRELAERAIARGVGDRVHIEGRVSDERAAELFESSRAYVLMSVCESFGIPAIEAMSFGTPVVTADCCAMPEVCGDAAELVRVDDLGHLADSIAGAILQPDLANRLRRSGFENVHRYRWGHIALRIASICERIVTEPNAIPAA